MATALKTVGDILDETKPAPRNIAQRINAVMGEVDYIQKEKRAGMQYTIVSHDKVTGLVRPILHAHGVVYYPRDLSVSQNGNRTEAVFSVRFENIDDRADFIDVATFGYGVDTQDKGPGKAMSYGVKYALLKLLGLETGDDPDEEQGAKAEHKPHDVAARSVPPVPRADKKLAGPYTSKSALWAAVRAFVHEINGMGDLGELIGYLETPEVKALFVQCERDAPGLLRDGLPETPEYVPIEIVIHQRKRDLEQVDEIKSRNPIVAG